MATRQISKHLGLNASDWVMVRSKEEILSTLDSNARLDELPFMPQMLAYCGQKIRVRYRAHKVCDTVNETGARKLSNAVVLDNLRCDGQMYGGCEMKCTIIWKEAWLRRADDAFTAPLQAGNDRAIPNHQSSDIPVGCSESDVMAGTHAREKETDGGEPVYVCQATQLPYATQPLSRWAIGQYVEDYRSGNVRISDICTSLLALAYCDLAETGLGFGSALRWAYDKFQKIRGGNPFPFRKGHVPKHMRTPSANLNIQVGELVQVRCYNEILDTVDEDLKNRGMSFHAEMATHCGKSYQVSQRLSKLMNEKTGQLMVLKNQCLVLEGVECIGMYAKPIYCPRASHLYWRELWLERIPQDKGETASRQGEGQANSTP